MPNDVEDDLQRLEQQQQEAQQRMRRRRVIARAAIVSWVALAAVAASCAVPEPLCTPAYEANHAGWCPANVPALALLALVALPLAVLAAYLIWRAFKVIHAEE